MGGFKAMSGNVRRNSQVPSGWMILAHGPTVWMLGFACAAFAINGLLFMWSLDPSFAAMAGCGGESGCGEVLASRWSQVMGVPVAAFGVLLYVGVISATVSASERLLLLCMWILLGAIGWFVFLQLVVLERFCPWCMVAHGLGFGVIGFYMLRTHSLGLLWMRSMVVPALAAVLVTGFIIGQVLGPVPQSYRVADTQGIAAGGGGVHAHGDGRKVSFLSGQKVYAVESIPMLGELDAEHVLAYYFDYQCGQCREMNGYLAELMERHPGEVAVLVLPMPLDRRCNERMVHGSTSQDGSCELSRLALAVWRVEPGAFAGVHEAMFAIPGGDVDLARRMVIDSVPEAVLQQALGDPWIEEVLEANMDDWEFFSGETRILPKLLLRDARMLHGRPPRESVFFDVVESELGL